MLRIRTQTIISDPDSSYYHGSGPELLSRIRTQTIITDPDPNYYHGSGPKLLSRDQDPLVGLYRKLSKSVYFLNFLNLNKSFKNVFEGFQNLKKRKPFFSRGIGSKLSRIRIRTKYEFASAPPTLDYWKCL